MTHKLMVILCYIYYVHILLYYMQYSLYIFLFNYYDFHSQIKCYIICIN